jgi:thioredoxin reductase (NADPH)
LADAGRPARDRPVILCVDDDARGIPGPALKRRFGSDYEVSISATVDAGMSVLGPLANSGRDVALVVAPHAMEPETGTAFLARSREIQPTARRMVLTSLGDYAAVSAIARALTLGEVDYQVSRPLNGVDEQFLAAVGVAVADWAAENHLLDPRLTIIADGQDPDAHAMWETLERWGLAPRLVDASAPDGESMLARLGVERDLPVAVLPDGRTLVRPTVAQGAEALGLNQESLATPFDVVVLGSGPAGLSAAVNAASEGLRTLLVEPATGQASASPMLRNYLGFPSGISGAELLRRGWYQALWFGVQMQVGRAAGAIRREGKELIVVLDENSEVRSKTVVVATGLAHRSIGIPSVERLVGRGVFYGSGFPVASTLFGEPVAVIGGANSAAEAAVHLAKFASRVSVLVRSPSITDSMSDYLTQQLDSLTNVEIRLNTEVVDASEEQQLRSVVVRNNATGVDHQLDVTGLFILIGFAPRTDWLPDEIARDERGFVLTGDDARVGGDRHGPLPLETSMAGVFAAGDVRRDSVKRIATAVGEGVSVTNQIHEYLAQRGRQ